VFVCTLKKTRSLRPDESELVEGQCCIAIRCYKSLFIFAIADNFPVAAHV
jgi:hypothetical protein